MTSSDRDANAAERNANAPGSSEASSNPAASAPSGSDAQHQRVRALRASLERDPGDPSTHFGLGRALAKLGEHAEAVAAFQRATELRADYTAAWRELGRSEMARGDRAAAAAAFARGLEAAERSGDLQTAREIAVFQRRLERGAHPASADGAASTGSADANAGAAPAASAASEPGPGAPAGAEPVAPEVLAEARALYKQGFAHFARSELKDAIEFYERALAIAPSLAIAWNGLSMALGQAGRLDEAVEAAHHLVGLEPTDPLSHTNLSRLLMQRGQIPEAEDARAKAMQLQMKQAR